MAATRRKWVTISGLAFINVRSTLRNIDGRPFDLMNSGQPFMRPQNPTAKERSSTVLRFASFPPSILTLPGDAAELRLHRFSQVLQVMPPQKNRSESSVSRDFLAWREERPFVVPFERFSFRSERSALR